MTASATGLDRVGRNSTDFLILDVCNERESVVCDPVCGALCARDYKSVTSTIDGKLVAVKKSSNAKCWAFDAWSSTVDNMPDESCAPVIKCGTRIGVAIKENE